jgi:hypothetical protein
VAAAIDDVGNLLAQSISGLREALRSDRPLMGETLGGIAEGLQSVAQAIENSRTE